MQNLKKRNECDLIILGLILSGFSVKLWQFYGATALQFLHVCKYGLVRSLLSKCISKNDIGKIYSALSIIAATIPMAGNGIMRTLYNKVGYCFIE